MEALFRKLFWFIDFTSLFQQLGLRAPLAAPRVTHWFYGAIYILYSIYSYTITIIYIYITQ